MKSIINFGKNVVLYPIGFVLVGQMVVQHVLDKRKNHG